MDRARKILVSGGTGNIGTALVRMLHGSGAPVRVAARDIARAAAVLGAAIELVEGDLTRPESLAAAFAEVDRAFLVCPAGPGMAATAGAFAAAARHAGVQHIVAISSETIEIEPRVALGAWHAALERAITATGVATTFLRPNNFASNALRWAPTIRSKSMVFAARADGQSVPIDPWDIAAAAHAALTRPGHEGKVYTLTGPAVMSTRDQVEAIAAELGRPLRVVDVSIEQARAGMIGSGMPAIMADAILELLGQLPRPTPVVREVTGVEPRSFAQWVRDHRAAFEATGAP